MDVSNFFSLNEGKTEVIGFGNSDSQVLSELGNLLPFAESTSKNLGVQLNVSLKLIHAFIYLRMDDCNSLLAGLSYSFS